METKNDEPQDVWMGEEEAIAYILSQEPSWTRQMAKDLLIELHEDGKTKWFWHH